MDERKKHWEQVYQTKSPEQVSWTQAVPQTSLDFIKDAAVSKKARIIDVGGGDSKLLELAGKSVKQYLIIGTFSNEGPEKCSGLPVRQYSEAALQQTLAKDFQKIKCITEDHVTPFDTMQSFTFCSFKKANTAHI